jgi:hypothetical protein
LDKDSKKNNAGVYIKPKIILIITIKNGIKKAKIRVQINDNIEVFFNEINNDITIVLDTAVSIIGLLNPVIFITNSLYAFAFW